MRVLILTHFYDPEPIPKPSELAYGLQERGHTVTVITGLPNYPTGRLYKGYRFRLFHEEMHDGVKVLRGVVWPSHSTSVLGRMANYLSAMISAIVVGFFSPPCDVIYVFHPPLTIGVAAWIIGLAKRAPIVLDVQDIWPESVVISGMVRSSLIVRLLYGLERFVYKRATGILLVTEAAGENLRAKGVDIKKLHIMRHWIDDKALRAVPLAEAMALRVSLGLLDQFIVMFAGNMGVLQGLDTVLETAYLMREERVAFMFVGDGVDRSRLITHADRLGLGNIVFVERQPGAAMPLYFACADALLVHLRRQGVSEFVIPTKTIAYLAAGRPIIMAMDGPSARLVKESGAGVVVPPESPEMLASAIRRLIGMPANLRIEMGAAGRKFAAENFMRSKVIKRYEDVLVGVSRTSNEDGKAPRPEREGATSEVQSKPPL